MAPKNDASKPSDATKTKTLAAKTRAKLGEVTGRAVGVAERRLRMLGKARGHRLQEAAQKVAHFGDRVATKVIHSAQEAAQKVTQAVDEAKGSAEHRRQELVDKLDEKLEPNSKATGDGHD